MPAVTERPRLTQGIEAPTYGIGNPLEMIVKSAPNAGVEGTRIWNQGKAATETILSTEEEVNIEDAIRNNFAFVQIAAASAGDPRMIANISTPLCWDRQTPMEDAAKEIVERIGGENAQLLWFGSHKLVALVREDERPEHKLLSLIEAPGRVYETHLPNLANAQKEIQRRRFEEILNSEDGNGRKFIDIFDGEENMDRAYQEDQKYSFAWGTQKVNDELVATNLDNELQSIVALAFDDETREMLQKMQDFFSGNDPLNRYFILFDFSNTASCANISSNAQYVGSNVWEKDALTLLDSSLRIYPNGEIYIRNKTCPSCLKGDESCECEDDTKKAKQETSEASEE